MEEEEDGEGEEEEEDIAVSKRERRGCEDPSQDRIRRLFIAFDKKVHLRQMDGRTDR